MHSAWLSSRLCEGDAIYRFPASLVGALQAALGLDQQDTSAEAHFDELCLRFGSVGVWSGRPIKYRWLLPRHGGVTADPDAPDGLEERPDFRRSRIGKEGEWYFGAIPSIIGRRLSNPDFLADRDRLKAEWLAMPQTQRPPFPLYQTRRTASMPSDTEARTVPPRIASFLREFDRFCKRWRLLGMITWDLLDPEGPMWPEMPDSRPSFGLVRCYDDSGRVPLTCR